MANPNPVHKFKQQYERRLAKDMVGVRLPIEVDAYVRSLPNRTEWLRKVIADAYERDLQAQQQQAS